MFWTVESGRRKAILAIALPIVGGMVSQNVLNLVDTLMVSRLGKEAVAAVGIASFCNFLATAFITGMSAGVQAMASRRKGEGRESEMAIPLNGGLLVVAALAIPLSALFIWLAPHALGVLLEDQRVVDEGAPYLRARLVAMIAIGMNFAFRGYWNGVGRSSLYLRTLIVMHLANIAISYVLIFGALGFPELGTTGAGVGTMMATFIGTGYYFYLGRRYARDAGFLAGIPKWETVRTMLRLSVPSGIQQTFFAAGFTALFTIIGLVGTAELAAANVLMNITLVALLPGLGLGLAAASLIGQSLGRGDTEDATAWGWDVVRFAVGALFLLGLPMVLFPGTILLSFFPDEPDALALGIGPLRLIGATIAIDGVGMVLLNSIMGAGATRLAMVVSIITQWFLFLPAAYVVGPLLGGGLMAIWLANVAYRAVFAATMATIWRSRRWAGVAV